MPTPSEVGAVVVAAGESRRMGGVDKIFALIGGRPLIAYTLEAIVSCRSIGRTVLVLHADSVERGRRLVQAEGWGRRIAICAGGVRRQDSVATGLAQLDLCEWVVIHDGARPMVTPDLIERGLAAAKGGAAIAGVPVKETIKCVGPGGQVERTLERSRLWTAQTPQVFRLSLLREAHRHVTGDVTDDASMVEALGHPVKVYLGASDNLKVTTPEDLVLAEFLLKDHARRLRL